MRRLIALILAVLLLCGCAPLPPQATNPSPVAGGENVGRDGNLWYLPNEAVAAMDVTQLLATEGGLLLCGGETLKLLSEEDLTLIAETTLDTSAHAYVQILEDGISTADPKNGTVTFLSPELEPVQTIQPDAPAGTWLLSSDGERLYAFSGKEISACTLADGQQETLLEVQWLSLTAPVRDRVILTCVGVQDLVTRWYGLDLRSGELSALEPTEKLAVDSGLFPLANGQYLDFGERELTLYDADGAFLSRCVLSGGEDDRCGTDFVWSERWQGWFFIDYLNGQSRLMFWDPVVETEGTSVDLVPETVPVGEILPQELYNRAEALSERFSMDIRIADRCIRDYKSYTSEVLTDPEVTAAALDVLESALGQYPEGFLAQLGFSNVETIRIELVDDLKAKSGADVSSGTSAFAQRRDGYYLLVLNARRIRNSVIYHELSHVIDKRLDWDASLREDALYSDEGWMALQPEGFAYAGSYQNIPDSVKQYYDSGYFVREYSCVSASEDRAMTMEKAMMGEQAVFDANPHLMPKLEYYCACIRDSFNTEGWPEVTLWEQLLE